MKNQSLFLILMLVIAALAVGCSGNSTEPEKAKAGDYATDPGNKTP
ncbi:MAG: hypothetical protein SFX74_12705 [Fimbriimonadaceae bacterium]|nr:hypothetical protein [Fimbriimonadaceae bacterium]